MKIIKIILNILKIIFIMCMYLFLYQMINIGNFITFLVFSFFIFLIPLIIFDKTYDFSFKFTTIIYAIVLILFANYFIIFIGIIFIWFNLYYAENLNFKFLTIIKVRILNLILLFFLVFYYSWNIYFYFVNIKYLDNIKDFKIECKENENRYLNIDLKEINKIYNNIMPSYKDLKKETDKNCKLLIFRNDKVIKAKLTYVEYTRNKSSVKVNAYLIEFDDMPNYYFISKDLYKYLKNKKIKFHKIVNEQKQR